MYIGSYKLIYIYTNFDINHDGMKTLLHKTCHLIFKKCIGLSINQSINQSFLFANIIIKKFYES